MIALCLKRFLPLALLCAACAWAQYDVVVANGRVMDPESGLDAVRHLGIVGGTIRAVSQTPLTGRRVIDAAGLVVSPGFIDLHWHGRDIDSYRYAAMQGVTAALELEIGVADVSGWYSAREGKSWIHFGASAGHPPARMAVMKDPGDFLPSGDAANRAATDEEITAMKLRLVRGLQDGAPAVGFGIAYTQAATVKEIIVTYGVVLNCDEPGNCDYLSGVEVSIAANVGPDLMTLRIPSRRYAVFTYDGHISAIQQVWKSVWSGSWFPETGYEATGDPALERYGERFDPRTGNGGFEIWIPVRRQYT